METELGIIAVLSSPSSFRANDEMEKIHRVILGGSGIFHYEVEKHKDIAEALTRFQQSNVDAIVIIGDRALTSATYEHIVENELFKGAGIPLAILPAGDNNIVAENLGATRPEPHLALKKILQKHKTGNLLDSVIEYPLLKLEGVREIGYLYGLSFCAGKIIKQKNLFNRKISRKGLFHHIGNWLNIIGLTQSGYRGAMGKKNIEDAIRVNRNQRGAVLGHFFMLMITTLEKSFWGISFSQKDRPDTAHFISVENTKESVIQSGKQMFRGYYDRSGVAGHVITEIQHARIVLQTPFVLDGSYYQTDDTGELFVTLTERLKFIQLS